MFTECSLVIPGHVQDTFWTFPECSLDISRKHPVYFLVISRKTPGHRPVISPTCPAWTFPRQFSDMSRNCPEHFPLKSPEFSQDIWQKCNLHSSSSKYSMCFAQTNLGRKCTMMSDFLACCWDLACCFVRFATAAVISTAIKRI
jgi:hypothetical protein